MFDQYFLKIDLIPTSSGIGNRITTTIISSFKRIINQMKYNDTQTSDYVQQ